MKKLALLLCLLLLTPIGALAQGGPVTGPINQIICNKTAFAAPAAAGTLSLVNGVAGQAIHLCGWHVTSNQSAVTTFQLVYGTQGGPCGTPTNITPAFSVTSTAPSGDHQGSAIYSTPTGSQLCVATTGATVGAQVMIYYSQF